VMVKHLLNKRDTILDLLRAGDVYPLSASS